MTDTLKPIITWRGAIRYSGLPPVTRHVALTLALYMNEAGESAHPGAERLALDTGLAVRSVRSHLAGLVDAGWLRVTERGGQKGETRRSNAYAAVIPDGLVLKHPTPAPPAPIEETTPATDAGVQPVVPLHLTTLTPAPPAPQVSREVSSKTQPPPNPASGEGKIKGTRATGTNPRAQGTNPRAEGTNPRAMETNPRAQVVPNFKSNTNGSTDVPASTGVANGVPPGAPRAAAVMATGGWAEAGDVPAHDAVVQAFYASVSVPSSTDRKDIQARTRESQQMGEHPGMFLLVLGSANTFTARAVGLARGIVEREMAGTALVGLGVKKRSNDGASNAQRGTERYKAKAEERRRRAASSVIDADSEEVQR